MEVHSLIRLWSCKITQKDGLMGNGRKRLMSGHALRNRCIPKINRDTSGTTQLSQNYNTTRKPFFSLLVHKLLLLSCFCRLPRGWFWGFEETRARNITCLSAQGHASIMVPVLQKNITVTWVLWERFMELLLRDVYFFPAICHNFMDFCRVNEEFWGNLTVRGKWLWQHMTK